MQKFYVFACMLSFLIGCVTVTTPEGITTTSPDIVFMREAITTAMYSAQQLIALYQSVNEYETEQERAEREIRIRELQERMRIFTDMLNSLRATQHPSQ